jgi:hypothetical protein
VGEVSWVALIVLCTSNVSASRRTNPCSEPGQIKCQAACYQCLRIPKSVSPAC